MPVASQPAKKLGRKAVVTDTRTMRLSKFFTATLPPPPISRDWSKGVKAWSMLLNDTLGDCTCAGIGHAIQVWTANSSIEATVTDDDVLAAYEVWCGYNPADPSTDQGGIELSVLKDFKAQGFAGHNLTAFASVLPANTVHVQQAINLFVGLYIGMDVPQYIMPTDGSDTPLLWDLNPTADNTIIGGHCVYVTGYDQVGPKFISWGANYQMTWRYWGLRVDEAYALISKDFIAASGLSPSGFSLMDLETDLVNIS
jgi:hypothetical protein